MSVSFLFNNQMRAKSRAEALCLSSILNINNKLPESAILWLNINCKKWYLSLHFGGWDIRCRARSGTSGIPYRLLSEDVAGESAVRLISSAGIGCPLVEKVPTSFCFGMFRSLKLYIDNSLRVPCLSVKIWTPFELCAQIAKAVYLKPDYISSCFTKRCLWRTDITLTKMRLPAKICYHLCAPVQLIAAPGKSWLWQFSHFSEIL